MKYETARFDEAIADCTKAIGLDNKHLLAHYCRACASFGKGDLYGAIADFSEVIRLDARNAMGTRALAHQARGSAYERLGQKTEAAADFAEARRLSAGGTGAGKR